MVTKAKQERWIKLTPEQRESVERIRARRSTPKHLAEVDAAQAQIRKEFPPAPRSAPPASSGYLALIAAFPLRPIRSDEELAAATKSLEALGKRLDLEEDEEDYFSVLADLIMAYESKHHAFPMPKPAEMLRHLLETRNVSQSELSRATGISTPIISEILSGKRRVAINHVDKFATFFRISPEVFIERSAGE